MNHRVWRYGGISWNANVAEARAIRFRWLVQQYRRKRCAVAKSELGAEVAEMRLHGLGGNEQTCGDLSWPGRR